MKLHLDDDVDSPIRDVYNEAGRWVARIDAGGPTIKTRWALTTNRQVSDAHLAATTYGPTPEDAMRAYEERFTARG